ncbi:UvrD-helicase domain-containing protein [Aquimarina algicola]|uniref:DNA 3'-5' helicase n=1 Tax=Aquimarina algicola TaxID=2589995 RepID=A0A504JMW5_9FLAO|nr:UvrD-helicase domain-containing protein [Aquimarina algicola]TPN87760.1 DNA helicase UvrD [Aquimarina algicola]
MNSTIAFTIYNAAAGAGKTYTLVKAYLITLLKGEFKDSYKNILAITFTNKAVAEMKTRVIESLVGLSQPNTLSSYQELLDDLINETKIPEQKLKHKADQILKSILHNYAAFDIVTIDTFTHRVIRTFAYDLGIPMNFEIEMDSESLVEEAVDSVIAKIGIDKELTSLIIDFAISKLEEDKSWDISIELNKVAKLLFSENDKKHLDKLSDKKIIDFENLKKSLIQKKDQNKKTIITTSENTLTRIKNQGIDFSDFTRGSIPKHFQKLAQGETKIDFTKTKWMQDITTTDFYNKSLDQTKKQSIDMIRNEIEYAFNETKKEIIQLDFYQNIIKNLTPLSILNTINQELAAIKKERRVLLISEFNTIISSAIKNQPAPFIYERLGERYRDYFIDEFQDTSELQWNNIIPLVDNAVSSETLSGKRGQITIVGDAKQAIYRWRGGKAEQFINLFSGHNPFSIEEKQTLNLPKNYRSHEEVIKFNNDFFTFLSNDFSNLQHQELYKIGNQQETNSKTGGYVNISFIEAKNTTQENEMYPEKVYHSILDLSNKGYKLNEICIIVRKQKEGAFIADYLTEKGISIISSETLLIKNAPEVAFIIDILTWNIYPENLLSKINILHFLVDRFNIKDKHSFLEEMTSSKKESFSIALKSYGITFNFNLLTLKPVYDAVEYIISSFGLADHAKAYIQFFLDVVFSFTQKHTESTTGFLSYWNTKKEKLSIVAPKTEHAIQIMTIHKAKGLEFPCVIYPYADINIYEEIEPKTWITINKDHNHNFEEAFINYNKKISDYNTHGNEIVLQRQSQLELDNINLLYVVLTRAKEQLYIISNVKLNARKEKNPNRFSGKLIAYLEYLGKWNSEITTYEFGSSKKCSTSQNNEKESSKVIQLSTRKNYLNQYKVYISTNSGKLWDTTQQNAIEKGNLIHELMASIKTKDDINFVVNEAFHIGKITSTEKETLLKDISNVINHPELYKYFAIDNKIYNEREIMANGVVFRPDRIIVDKENTTTIIDYKTGDYKDSHARQIREYGIFLEQMGHNLKHSILIYFNDHITLKHI